MAVAHRLKGSLGSVGFDAIYFELEKLETQLVSRPLLEPSKSQFLELTRLFEETSKYVSNIN